MNLKRKFLKILTYINHRFIDKYILNIPEYSKLPFKTHLPILKELNKKFKFKNILELGSGNYSTKLFLNKKVFSSLESLVTVEDCYMWYKKTKKKFNSKKLKIVFSKKISETIKNISIRKYDLIFIDNSMISDEREKTIKNLCSRKLSNQIIIIHDYEHYPYRFASQKIKYKYRFTCLTPNVGILSNKYLEKKYLNNLNNKIKNNNNAIYI